MTRYWLFENVHHMNIMFGVPVAREGGGLGAISIKILVVSNPTGFMLTSLGFCGGVWFWNVMWILVNGLVIFWKIWICTVYLSHSAGSPCLLIKLRLVGLSQIHCKLMWAYMLHDLPFNTLFWCLHRLIHCGWRGSSGKTIIDPYKIEFGFVPIWPH